MDMNTQVKSQPSRVAFPFMCLAFIVRSPCKSAAILVLGFVSMLSAQGLRRPLVVNQSRYRVVAGERITIEAPSETMTFMRGAKTRIARGSGPSNRAFPVGPNVEGNQILLGVPLTTEPGDYSVDVSFVSEAGEERTGTIRVMVEPFATPAAASSTTPVVLLDGFQASLSSSCPMSSDSSGTFGYLKTYLGGSPNFNPNVYFFENCKECPNCSIEQLGADLGIFLNLLGVPQVDVVAHSMGGLIVRSYLSGKQAASGAFSPPLTQRIRKAVFVATPHFGSFQADSLVSDVLYAGGEQDNEMKRGSQFLWDLATWNQFGDDLRGVDAVSVIGNAGPSQQSDGVVYSTSGSLDFASEGRTRVVGYCHIPPSWFGGLAGFYTGCNALGIAYIDSPSHQTYEIISSFLISGNAWQGVGKAPAEDQYLSKYGGLVVADVNAADQFIGGLSGVSWGGVNLSNGAASGELFYNDFVSGTGTFSFGSSTCGPYKETTGLYSAVRCKFAPSVHSVAPLIPGAARVVQAGTTITISGSGFGAQQCATCRVAASNPQSTVLQISSWSDTTIKAFLPASYGIGVATIGVTTASGSDAINIMANVAQSSGLGFIPITPCRVVDTRNPFGPFGGPYVVGNTARDFPIPASTCGIPSSAGDFSFNLTVVPHGPLSYLTIYPTGQARPLVSTLNSLDGRIKANAAIVPAGTSGSVTLFATNDTDVILDINGYYISASGTSSLAFYPVAPCRVSDTRNAPGILGGPILGSGQTRDISVTGSPCGIPPSAQAYSLNFTVVPQGGLGYLTTWPTGSSRPLVSTLNSPTGAIVANAAIVPAGLGGAVSVFATSQTDVVIDINGYFAPPGGTGALSFYPAVPCRISDTRNAVGTFGGPTMIAGQSRVYPIPSSACSIPASAQAYSLNATVVPTGTLGYLTLWPSGQAQPFVSTLNALDGSVVANAAIVPAGAGGAVAAFATNATHLILDINGYFAP